MLSTSWDDCRYISDLLRETIDRAVEREQMQNDWKEIWAKNKRHDKIQ